MWIIFFKNLSFLISLPTFSLVLTLREKCPKTEFFSGPYFPKSPYSVRIYENTDQIKLRIWTLFRQCYLTVKWSCIMNTNEYLISLSALSTHIMLFIYIFNRTFYKIKTNGRINSSIKRTRKMYYLFSFFRILNFEVKFCWSCCCIYTGRKNTYLYILYHFLMQPVLHWVFSICCQSYYSLVVPLLPLFCFVVTIIL